jgi:hypothetical protein
MSGPSRRKSGRRGLPCLKSGSHTGQWCGSTVPGRCDGLLVLLIVGDPLDRRGADDVEAWCGKLSERRSTPSPGPGAPGPGKGRPRPKVRGVWSRAVAGDLGRMKAARQTVGNEVILPVAANGAHGRMHAIWGVRDALAGPRRALAHEPVTADDVAVLGMVGDDVLPDVAATGDGMVSHRSSRTSTAGSSTHPLPVGSARACGPRRARCGCPRIARPTSVKGAAVPSRLTAWTSDTVREWTPIAARRDDRSAQRGEPGRCDKPVAVRTCPRYRPRPAGPAVAPASGRPGLRYHGPGRDRSRRLAVAIRATYGRPDAAAADG